MAEEDKGRAAGGRRRTGQEAGINQAHVQPVRGDVPEDADDAAKAKAESVGGEGTVGRAEAVAAAQAGNEEVADRFRPELEQGFRGVPVGPRIDATVEAQLEFLKLDPEAQREKLLEHRRLAREAQYENEWG